jgi:GNAT superfamily N-acetyltransferase
MEITIRKALKTDLQAIYNLVVELAIYEKEPDAVTASITDYRECFDEAVYEAHVAVCDEKIVGTAIYYLTYSTWKGKMLYLEDLVVTQSYRRKGVGQLLFDAVLAEAKIKAARLLKWQVLDWNDPAIDFYKKNEAILETNWDTGKIFID